MENRFNNDRPEERQDWGRYATPPPRPGEKHSPGENEVVQRVNVTSLCARVQDTFAALLENDGGIRPEMAAAIRAHLAGCPECAREYREMQQLVALVEKMPMVDLPRDFSAEIMLRIEQMSSHSRPVHATRSALPTAQTAVVKTLTNKTNQTHTLHGTQTFVSRLGVLPRLFFSALMTALLGLFVTSGWGRQALGSNLAVANSWLAQMGEAIRSIPFLGWIAAGAFAALTQAGETLQSASRTLSASAVGGIAFDIAVGGAVCAFLIGKQRMQSRGYDGGRRG